MPRRVAAILTALVVLQPGLYARDKIPSQLHWSELGAYINNQKIALVIPNGPRLEGRVLVVEPEALRLEVRKTSDAKAFAKGEASVPRASVTTLELRQMHIRGRVIGTAVGAVPFAALAVLVADLGLNKPGRAAAGLAAAASLPVAGYFLGRLADRKNTTITVLPEAAP